MCAYKWFMRQISCHVHVTAIKNIKQPPHPPQGIDLLVSMAQSPDPGPPGGRGGGTQDPALTFWDSPKAAPLGPIGLRTRQPDPSGLSPPWLQTLNLMRGLTSGKAAHPRVPHKETGHAHTPHTHRTPSDTRADVGRQHARTHPEVPPPRSPELSLLHKGEGTLAPQEPSSPRPTCATPTRNCCPK